MEIDTKGHKHVYACNSEVWLQRIVFILMFVVVVVVQWKKAALLNVNDNRGFEEIIHWYNIIIYLHSSVSRTSAMKFETYTILVNYLIVREFT